VTNPAPIIDLSFPHNWEAEVLSARPLILPPRHFVYPLQAEEVERGALEVLVRPGAPDELRQKHPLYAQQFLATFALGFRDPAVPTGLWSCPEPEELCAISGGYAYLIHTAAPERFTMLPYRPVLEVRPVLDEQLLLFIGHRNILAWGRQSEAWQSEKLSDEGLTITGLESGVLRGLGWEMRTDKEMHFALDLRTGCRLSSPQN
jgi:hypothetical protein